MHQILWKFSKAKWKFSCFLRHGWFSFLFHLPAKWFHLITYKLVKADNCLNEELGIFLTVKLYSFLELEKGMEIIIWYFEAVILVLVLLVIQPIWKHPRSLLVYTFFAISKQQNTIGSHISFLRRLIYLAFVGIWNIISHPVLFIHFEEPFISRTQNGS